MSFVVIQSSGSVRPNNLLAINLRGDRDVLTDGETERVGSTGKGKSVPGAHWRKSARERIQVVREKSTKQCCGTSGPYQRA